MARVVVYHGSFGCETGCCGHYVELQDDAGKFIKETFAFGHPYWMKNDPTEEEQIAYAKELIIQYFGEEHVADLDWENSFIYDD